MKYRIEVQELLAKIRTSALSSREKCLQSIEFGVRLGLEAAADLLEVERAQQDRLCDRIALANARIVVREIDPAGVLGSKE